MLLPIPIHQSRFNANANALFSQLMLHKPVPGTHGTSLSVLTIKDQAGI